MTTDLEERLRRALHHRADAAPLAAPTWTGPTYVLAPRRRRDWPVLAAAAAVIALLVAGVVVVQRDDHSRVATGAIDSRPRALPEGLSGWDIVDAVDNTGWNPVGDPSVQLFRRDDGATVRIVAQSTTRSASPGEAPQLPATTAAVTTTAAGRDAGGSDGSWQGVGDGGVVSFTVGDQEVSVQVEGMNREDGLALVADLTGSPGAYSAPAGFAAAGTSAAGNPHVTSSAYVFLARAGATASEVTIFTTAVPPGRSDIRLDQLIGGTFGTYEGSGSDTFLVVGSDDTPTARYVAWLQNGARIVVASPSASIVELKAIAAATHLASVAGWQAQLARTQAHFQSLPEISRVNLGDATIVARGPDASWPAVLCLEADRLARCFRNQQKPEADPSVVMDSIVLDGWWLIGFAQGGLSAQSALTPDTGTTTLRRARVGDLEWFAARMPDGATWAQGEMSTKSGSGSGGPWYRP